MCLLISCLLSAAVYVQNIITGNRVAKSLSQRREYSKLRPQYYNHAILLCLNEQIWSNVNDWYLEDHIIN